MRKETKPMREIHEIQEKIYEEQRQMPDKEKIEAIHEDILYLVEIEKVAPMWNNPHT